MEQKLENFINLLGKSSLNYYDFLQKANDISSLKEIINVKDFDDWNILGLGLVKTESGKVTLKSKYTDFKDQVFCVVDIETSGGINSGQIIEIGALKLLDGVEIGRFESFVYAPNVPENISELTGIYAADLAKAPSLANVLEKFKLFLGDSVFVAHNVKFDYDFISISLERLGFGMLLNRRICTIDLARRTIISQKYGLGTLKELLGISNAHHRALNDAIAAAEIFKECVKRVPWSIQSVEDLIIFSKTAKSLKLPNTLVNAKEFS
ncbi:3'-5' exonuclease [Campylobacter fetus]|uniref:3'-5' exonuclease n=1 Tax=Campylobacter fetus TaxID=196 RepID=UPI000557E5B6|nr:3'-5' exonuclease [Campylobacter fetus]OCS28355.1 DNA polymerase III subunit epsilon [Campylobacter fetus subsp. venerealis CCUG 33872]OCS37316.1 DNA polymerase III subunit epsilon [Campylobacter fetus subsp. venerealis]OCS39094.1 DNA polymerase III subunit epsilon [Campylobacter fetus subsp. venerealis]QMS61873.1 3'-5' exonuclease [Campylobacter fetus]WKW21716.1 3'-5' exonuclease [Campylobacter fetus subsp. venerealis]